MSELQKTLLPAKIGTILQVKEGNTTKLNCKIKLVFKDKIFNKSRNIY